MTNQVFIMPSISDLSCTNRSIAATHYKAFSSTDAGGSDPAPNVIRVCKHYIKTILIFI